jgi:hypothetical protein
MIPRWDGEKSVLPKVESAIKKKKKTLGADASIYVL